jgi:hypothetical protein
MLCTYGEHVYFPYGSIFPDEGFIIGEETAAYHPRNLEDNPVYGIVADNQIIPDSLPGVIPQSI